MMIVGSIVASIAGLALVALILFALKNRDWSRLFVFSFAASSAFGFGSYRLIIRSYLRHRQLNGDYARNAVLIGPAECVRWMRRYFAEKISSNDYRLLGYFGVSSSADETEGMDLRRMGQAADLGESLINHPIHNVIAVHPICGGDWIRDVIRACDYFGVMLHLVPEALLLEEQRYLQTNVFHPLQLPAIVLTAPNWDSEALFFKRVFDMVISLALLVVLAPVFLVIALVIKITTPHLPVFYKWWVVGRNGVEFTGYKFTTMISDADHLKDNLQSQNEMTGPVFKIQNDPRITPIGRILRKYSLNELPQLWSVLKGDMSLVGPRPAFRHELDGYDSWHKRKLSISPGITCLWQIRGRNKISNFDDWVRMDLEYIDNWSLWLDFKILMRTAWVVIAGTGS